MSIAAVLVLLGSLPGCDVPDAPEREKLVFEHHASFKGRIKIGMTQREVEKLFPLGSDTPVAAAGGRSGMTYEYYVGESVIVAYDECGKVFAVDTKTK